MRKSRVNWLYEREKNTKFFHTVTAQKIKRNRTKTIQREDGTECRGEKEIAREIANYCDNLFTTTSPQDFEEVLDRIL